MEEDEDWEDQQDRVLITQPIVGCAFKKTYYNPIRGHNVSENILAKDLVVDYYTKSLDTASRISHVLYLTNNDVYERVARGLYLDVDIHQNYTPPQDSLQIAQDKAQGISPPQQDESKPLEFIEQHCNIDFDEDGYEEPYIVVVHKESKKVVRIVARYFPGSVEYAEDKIISIKPETYFTKYPFIPSPDGGFYDLGFGVLLGPLNESINTLINQLIDAGTMANTAGGFLSRGIKVRGGTLAFSPNEWKPVDTTGDDLRKGIMPLPVREPNQVLFTLLSLLINYGERIGGAVDILVGQNPGQNTPAETSRTMAEQGMKIFTGIFKRTYRSMKDEFRKLYRLNQLYIVDKFQIGDLVVTPEDYNGSAKDLFPAADPNMVSDSQRMMQAQQLASIANPMLGYNMREVQLRILDAWRIEDIDKILPDPQGPNKIPPFTPPQVMLEQVKGQNMVAKEKVKAQSVLQKVQFEMQGKVAELELEAQLNQAKIDQLQADSLLKLTQADNDAARLEIATIDAQIGAAKQHQDHILRTIELMHKIKTETASAKSSDEG